MGNIKSTCPNPIGRVLRHGIFHNVSCKSWKCPHCSKIKKLKLIKRFERNKGSFRYRMLTLTEWKHPDNYDNSKLLTQHWNRLKSSLRKKTKDFEGYILKDYIWTKEYKPLERDKNYWVKIQAKKYNAMNLNDAIKYIMANYNREKAYYDRDYPDKVTSLDELFYPHLHVAVPAYIDVKRIRHLWQLATNQTANMVHIPTDEELIVSNPVAYMTKYLTKSDMVDGFSCHERRYGCSRKYPAKELECEYEYEIDGEIVKGKYIPYSQIDKNIWFILNPRKGQKVLSDEIWIRNEKRIGDKYQESKLAQKILSNMMDKYFSKRFNDKNELVYELSYEDQLNYTLTKIHLERLNKFLCLQ